MSYIHKVINSHEKILVVARPHWIYFVEGLLCLGGLILTGFILDYYVYLFMESRGIVFSVDQGFLQFNQNDLILPWLLGLVGFGIFWPLFLTYISVEISMTDQRIIYKKGLLFIEVDQVDLGDIRAEQVYHGWLGWMLGYGKVHLDCRFVGDVWLPAIAKPYRLVKAIHIARLRHPDIEYDRHDLARHLARIEGLERNGTKRQLLSVYDKTARNAARPGPNSET